MTQSLLSTLRFPVLIAHRGYNVRYPENTLAAFEAALQLGARMIELDITLSRDRNMVVIHDDTLERTSNGKGAVGDYSLKELQELDAGSWFDIAFAGEKVPTLIEVLEQVNRRALVNIEIKSSAFEDPAPADAIENQVVELIRKMKLQDSIIISSFEIRFLKRIAAIDPSLALGMISTEPADASTVKQLKKLGVYSWHAWHKIITAGQVERLHAAGIKVFSFTVNEPEVLQNLSEMGVDGVFTDDGPRLMTGS
ncbi:MAG: glycerophosphodiester phosphodiesterase [SAR324 cluster bacterium]|nr:glycerophosphodiester phosphodiesterase [SAR324 cluster bacterium]